MARLGLSFLSGSGAFFSERLGASGGDWNSQTGSHRPDTSLNPLVTHEEDLLAPSVRIIDCPFLNRQRIEIAQYNYAVGGYPVARDHLPALSGLHHHNQIMVAQHLSRRNL